MRDGATGATMNTGRSMDDGWSAFAIALILAASCLRAGKYPRDWRD